MRVKGLLFDKDGTLYDFQATWAGWAAELITTCARGDAGLFARLEAALKFDAGRRHFLPGSPIIAATSRELAALIAPLLPDWRAEDLLTYMVDSAARATLVETCPLQDVLGTLTARGLKIGLATNDGEVAARAHLKRSGITRYFDMILGFDSGFGGKPAPGQCLAFAEAMDLPAGEIAMIGDSLHDLHAGRAAGMVCVGVLTGPATREDLESHADAVLGSIAELSEWLSG